MLSPPPGGRRVAPRPCVAAVQRGAAAARGACARRENRPHADDVRPRARLRFTHVDDDVMHVRAIAGAHFTGLHPPVLGEVGRDLEVLVVDRARRGHLDSRPASRTRASGVPICQPSGNFGSAGSSAGLPSRAPAVRPTRRSCRSLARVRLRSLRNVPYARSACHGGITRVVTFSRIALAHGRTSLIGDERHRRDFARPMAAHALGVEDRRHVAAEGREPPADAGVLRRPHLR